MWSIDLPVLFLRDSTQTAFTPNQAMQLSHFMNLIKFLLMQETGMQKIVFKMWQFSLLSRISL